MKYKSEKIKNLISLSNLFPKNVPNFLIIKNKKDIDKINSLKNNKLYIIRPCLPGEDNENKSLAGFLNSIYPIKKSDLLNIIDKFNLNKFELIIQEYIKGDYRGVLFTRDDKNILSKPKIFLSPRNNITSGKKGIQPPYLLRLELEEIGYKIEKYFNRPQDIEFVVKGGKIFLVQTRPLTSPILKEQIKINLEKQWKNIYDTNGIWLKIANIDEIKKIDICTIKILKKLFNNKIIIINKKLIYIEILSFLLYLNLNLLTLFRYGKNELNQYFLKYLNKKYFLLFLNKILFFQKINTEIFQIFENYKNYALNCKLYEKTFTKTTNIKKLNLKEKIYVYIEKEKLKLLKKIKDNIKVNINNSYEKLSEVNKSFLTSEKILFLFKGKNILNISKKENEFIIYPGNFEKYHILNISKFINEPKESIIFLKNFSEINNRYKFIEKYRRYIKGFIIENGNPLSHYAIILREFKIPSKILNT